VKRFFDSQGVTTKTARRREGIVADGFGGRFISVTAEAFNALLNEGLSGHWEANSVGYDKRQGGAGNDPR
jgi:hypothetical protein